MEVSTMHDVSRLNFWKGKMMATTFNEVADSCGSSQQCFVDNTDVLGWACVESTYAGIPIDLILAQWVAEGTWEYNSSGAACNDPGNAEHGSYSGCGTSYTTPGSCSAYSANYSSSTASDGVTVQADLINAKYCAIADAFNTSGLTSGGQQLYDWAQSQGFTMLQDGTYNAAYAWGASAWAGSHYEESHWVIGGSDIYGSALILFIQQDGLYDSDQVCQEA